MCESANKELERLDCLIYFVCLYEMRYIFPFRLVYTGIAPGYSQETGNCLVFIGVGIGHSVQFVLSEYISAEANLYVHLILSLTAVHLFVVADSHFGSGSSRSSCHSRKRDEKTVNSQPEVPTESAGNDTTLHMLASALVCSGI